MTILELPSRIGLGATQRTWSRSTSFRIVVAVQVLLLAASNFPTPLFPIYERRYGFSSATVTALFAVYVAVLIPTMLTLGRLADRVGRKPVLIAGVAVTGVSSLVFAAAQNVGWLFAGEIVYGIGAGLVMSCAAVAIRELHHTPESGGAALSSTLANAAGLTLGPLVSGILATVTPWPTVSPFVLDLALVVGLTIALLRILETRPLAAGAVGRAPAFHVPPAIRRQFAATAVAAASGWMLLGWVFGLAPSFLHVDLGVHVTQPVIAGLFAALAVFSNGVAQVLFRRHDSSWSMRAGMAGTALGMGIMAASTLPNSLALAIVGVVIAGASTGVVQRNAMDTILRIAPAHARGGVSSAFFTICYTAMSLPVVLAGLVADRVGLGVVSAWYFVALAVLVGAGLRLSWSSRVA